MAIHRSATALLLIASLFVAVAISRADARPTVRPNKMAALHRDAHGRGYVADAAAPTVLEPECGEDGKRGRHHKNRRHRKKHPKEAESPEPKPQEPPELGLP